MKNRRKKLESTKNSRSENWPKRLIGKWVKKKMGISKKILIRKIGLKDVSEKMNGKNKILNRKLMNYIRSWQ